MYEFDMYIIVFLKLIIPNSSPEIVLPLKRYLIFSRRFMRTYIVLIDDPLRPHQWEVLLDFFRRVLADHRALAFQRSRHALRHQTVDELVSKGRSNLPPSQLIACQKLSHGRNPVFWFFNGSVRQRQGRWLRHIRSRYNVLK